MFIYIGTKIIKKKKKKNPLGYCRAFPLTNLLKNVLFIIINNKYLFIYACI